MKRILEKADQARIRFVKVEFAILMICLVLLALVFSRPEIVGYASTSIHNQDLDLVISQSQRFYLRSVHQFPIHLTSLTMSGEVIGEGTAAIYLSNQQGEKQLVYRNAKRKDSTHNRVTGTSTAGTKLLGSDMTGSALPLKEEKPVLDLLEGPVLMQFESLHPSYKAVSGKFSHMCVDSCLLQEKKFTGSYFILDFYLQPGTKVKISDIVYTTLEEI